MMTENGRLLNPTSSGASVAARSESIERKPRRTLVMSTCWVSIFVSLQNWDSLQQSLPYGPRYGCCTGSKS